MSSLAIMPDVQDQVYELNVQMGAIRKAIRDKRLSLKQINKLSNQVALICQKGLKVERVASPIIASDLLRQGMELGAVLEEMRVHLWEEDRKVLQQLHTIDFEVENLRDQILFMPEEEVRDQLAELYQKVKETCPQLQENSPKLKSALTLLLQKISDVDFSLKFPIYQELFAESYQENFVQRIEQLSLEFISNKKTAFLQFLMLSEMQKEGIYLTVAKMKGLEGVQQGKQLFHALEFHDFERASAIQEYSQGLQKLCHLAKTALYEDIDKALLLFTEIPAPFQLRIEQLIWDKTGKNLEEYISENSSSTCELFAQAVMALASEKILA